MLAKNFDCSEDTIRRRIDILVQTGDIVEPQICVSTKIPDSLGRMIQETVIYNLTFFSEVFDVRSENTITNHVDVLVNRGIVDNVKNLTLLQSAR